MKVPLVELTIGEEEKKAVMEVLDSGWLLQGPRVKEWEKALESHFGVKHAIAVSSCTAALHLCCLSLDLGYTGKVIVPDFTFPASANAIIRGEGWPTFIDVHPLSLTLDSKNLEEALTRETKAVMPVHLFGCCPAEMDEILEFAKSHNLIVIEDAAGAFGGEYKGRKVGSFGNTLCCFSFDTRKVLTMGEGGVILTNEDVKADWFRMARSHGSTLETWDVHRSASLKDLSFPICGLNYRMTEIQAAIGLEQLKKLPWILRRRRAVARLYDELLYEDVLVPFEPPHVYHTYQSYVIALDTMDNVRFVEEMRKRGVQASYASRALHLEPCFKPYADCQRVKVFTISEWASKYTACLPIYPTMEDSQVQCVADCVKEVLKDA